jgi:hypothetical protein
MSAGLGAARAMVGVAVVDQGQAVALGLRCGRCGRPLAR